MRTTMIRSSLSISIVVVVVLSAVFQAKNINGWSLTESSSTNHHKNGLPHPHPRRLTSFQLQQTLSTKVDTATTPTAEATSVQATSLLSSSSSVLKSKARNVVNNDGDDGRYDEQKDIIIQQDETRTTRSEEAFVSLKMNLPRTVMITTLLGIALSLSASSFGGGGIAWASDIAGKGALLDTSTETQREIVEINNNNAAVTTTTSSAMVINRDEEANILEKGIGVLNLLLADASSDAVEEDVGLESSSSDSDIVGYADDKNVAAAAATEATAADDDNIATATEEEVDSKREALLAEEVTTPREATNDGNVLEGNAVNGESGASALVSEIDSSTAAATVEEERVESSEEKQKSTTEEVVDIEAMVLNMDPVDNGMKQLIEEQIKQTEKELLASEDGGSSSTSASASTIVEAKTESLDALAFGIKPKFEVKDDDGDEREYTPDLVENVEAEKAAAKVVTKEERVVEEDEFVHGDLNNAQINWLRKH